MRVRRRADRVAAPLLAASQGPLQRPTLCIWYPDDPPEQRWSPGDGLLTLIEMTRVRLFKEGWYRETGEWLGEEISRGQLHGRGRRRPGVRCGSRPSPILR